MVDQSHVFFLYTTPLFLLYGEKEENCCDVVSEESFAKRKKEKVF